MNAPNTVNPTAISPSQHMERGMRISIDHVISEIQTGAYRVRRAGGDVTWWDTQPMLDPREHSPEVLDMNHLYIQHGLDAGVLVRHPHQPYWVRIVAQAS